MTNSCLGISKAILVHIEPINLYFPTNALIYRIIRLQNLYKFRRIGGGERNRTDDLLLAKQALSQLSYTPVSNALDVKSLADIGREMVGLGRLELPTSRLSGVRSNQAELQARFGSNQLVERAYTVSAFGIRDGRDTPTATCRHLC